MILFFRAKLKTLSLAKQARIGAFINGALIGEAVVACTVIAGKARFGRNGSNTASSFAVLW